MVDALQALRPLIGCRLVAVDPGARYVGLAVRTCRLRGAQPYGLVERRMCHAGRSSHWALEHSRGFVASGTARGRLRFESQVAALCHVLSEQRAAAAVVGMPYYADGSRSPQCAPVERLVAQLQAAWPRPVLLWDESWSTRLAVGPRPRPRDARASHAAAACIILEEVLASLQPLEVGDKGMLLRDTTAG